METMRRLGVTGLIELPPAGTLVGLAKRAMPGVETARPEDPRRPRRRHAAAHPRARQRRRTALPTPPTCAITPDTTATRPCATDGALATPSRPSDRRRARPHPGRRRLPPRARRAPTTRSSSAIDSSDEWIRERSGIVSRRCAAAGRDRRRHGRGRRRARRSSAPASTAAQHRRRPRRDGHPPLPDPVRGAASSPTASAPRRPRRSTSPPPAPATATASPWPTTWSAAARPSTSSSSASRSCPTSPTRTTAAPPSSSATAPARSSSARPRPRASARRSGAPTAPSGRPSSQTRAAGSSYRDDPDAPAGRRSAMAGQTVFRWAVWGMAPVAQQALDAAGITADDLDAFIPHQANMRIIDAMVKQLKLPDRRPGRPRHRRDGQHVGGVRSRWRRSACCARGGAAAAGWPCRSASAPGWSTPPRSSCCPEHSSRGPRVPRATPHDQTHAQRRSTWRRRAGDPRGSGRDRQRGDRPAPTPSRRTSPSPTTSTSTRCR